MLKLFRARSLTVGSGGSAFLPTVYSVFVVGKKAFPTPQGYFLVGYRKLSGIVSHFFLHSFKILQISSALQSKSSEKTRPPPLIIDFILLPAFILLKESEYSI